MAYYPQPAVGPYGAPGPNGTQGPYGAPVPYGAYGAPVPYGAPAPVPYGAPAALPASYWAQMQYQPQGQFGTVPGYSQQLPPPPYSAAFSQKSYFFIRSRLNGLVLDVQGANPAPGTPVTTWKQKNDDNNNQLWFEDFSTGTIRSKLNEYCLDVTGNKVVLMPYQHGNQNQLWEPFSNLIRNRHQLSKVLTVEASSGGCGARIVVGNQSQQKNQTTQLFDFQFTSPQDVASTSASAACYTAPRRRFRIVSEMNCKVLDVRGGNPCSGTDVIMYSRKAGSHLNQLWYFDSQGVIRSALNDMALDSGVGGQKLRTMPYTGEARQQWHLVGNRITNKAHECLDICGESKKDGAEVISYKYKGSANQHWRIEYE